MRPYLITILVIFVLASSYNGQPLKNDGLVLTASLTSVRPKLNTESSKPVFRFELQLIVQIRNDSDQTLIVFKPLGDLVQKRVAFMSDLSDSGIAPYGLRPGPWISKADPYKGILRNYDPFANLIRELDYKEPVAGSLLKIEPGRYHEYVEVVTVEDGYRMEIKPGQSLREASLNSPFAEDPAFKIQYQLSLKKRHTNDDFLKVLQERWKRFGRLVLDDSGDFSMTSDIVINRSGG